MRLRHLLATSALALASLAVAPLAYAETPPDLVVMKSGGMLRGTISEMDPQGNVVIELSSGEKRSIAMSEVQYAGPAAAAAAPAAPAAPAPAASAPYSPPPAGPQGPHQGSYGGTQPLVTVHGVEARLQLRGDGVTFHRNAGSGTGTGYANGRAVAVQTTVYSSMCTAPCEVSMPRGKYTLALSSDGVPVEAEPVSIDGDGTLQGKYSSKAGLRVAGWVVVVGGMAGGFAIAFTGGDEDLDTTRLLLGTGVAVTAVLVGLILANTPDDAEIRFIPGAPISLTQPGDLRADSGTGFRGLEPGLSLAMNF